jgi:Glycosyl hydrolase family 79 C-terminal beta domain
VRPSGSRKLAARGRLPRGGWVRHGLALSAFVGAAVSGAVLAGTVGADRLDDTARAPLVRGDVAVSVGRAVVGRAVSAGFVGLSIEYPAVIGYAGADPAAVNPVLEQLIRKLAPNQRPILRVGGDSADRTWWPVSSRVKPRGVKYSISPRWLAVTRTLAAATRARLILGVNLEANQSAIAVAEARALLSGIGRRSVLALEIGNEPNWYATLPWYRSSGGRPVFGRPGTYDFRAFSAEFSALRKRLPKVPLAGPTVGALPWLQNLRSFLAAEPALRVVTLHRYPLNRCFTKPGSPDYPTVANLLNSSASRGLVSGITRYARIAHQRGDTFRIDEMNSVACGGKAGVSDTFASALWALDALFAVARSGADGVNIHTFPGARYGLFTFHRAGTRWSAFVRPEYYGLLMFAQAAPPGSRLLPVTRTGSPRVRGWATRAADGTIRLVLINDDVRHSHVVSVRLPERASTVTLERLTAPSAWAKRGVALGGQSFGAHTGTGTLARAPLTQALTAGFGGYLVTLPAATAAMITAGSSPGQSPRPP